MTLPAPRIPGPQRAPAGRMTPRRWVEYLVAILAGNGIYFLVLFPDLPPILQHQPFRFDLGLLLAFVCCVAIYGVIRLASAHARRMLHKRYPS
jgi:H+/gluconate symporter-like permease